MPVASHGAAGDLPAAAEMVFYSDHLKTVLLPFWLQRSIDEQHGGYFTCFDSEGRTLLSQDKFTWSQGRMVWVWAKLASMGIFAPQERPRFLALARSGADFLMQHCLLPNGHCTFLMTRAGTPKQQSPDLPLDSSVYADCFVVLGLARYAAVSGDQSAAQFALRLYRSVVRRISSGQFNSEPYPTPPGYQVHGIPMILLNTAQELAGGLAALAMAEAADAQQAAELYLRQTLAFAAPDGTLHECITTAGDFDHQTLLGRYTNPGHALEDMWFVLHQVRGGDNAFARRTIARAGANIQRAFAIGWDAEHGGLFQFADQDGGQPRGSIAGIENEKMTHKVINDWANKLWWVHSEALYATLLAWRLSGDDTFLALYHKVRDYTFRTFPNPDPAIGEWIQIRDRQGRPEQKVVALPVKDPFHIIRNVALMIDLLADAR